MITDSERLDFVLGETCILQIFDTTEGDRFSLFWVGYGEIQKDMYKTPREAIDAAIKLVEEKTDD